MFRQRCEAALLSGAARRSWRGGAPRSPGLWPGSFTWPQLAAFILLPVAWWFILLYGIAPLLLPAFSTPKGELNAFLAVVRNQANLFAI